MNVLLVALNAKFSHSSLALRYLETYCQREFPQIQALEYNINQNIQEIVADIINRKPDVVGFSCYIWNIELILPIISDLAKVCPETSIILGGPEVSFDVEYWLETYDAIDYLIAGEGEESLLRFLQEYKKSNKQPTAEQLKSVPGLVFRIGDKVVQNGQEPLDLSTIPPIYDGDLSKLENKIVYYETTRGCPFRCAYCLSSVMGQVREFPMDLAKKELRSLAATGVEQVRFVDRTFNYDAKRAFDLIEFMIGLDTGTRFQLEVSGDILTEPILQLLKTAPENRFQFEIGVQSTNESTLKAVHRHSNLKRLAEVVKFLKDETTVRVLLDLISGLPDEGFARFGESFDYVFSLRPDRIHLGFLKLLRGSHLREEAESFGCVYTERAPYEVLYTDCLSYEELQRLKRIDDLLDKYYGSRFERSIEFLCEERSPFEFFNDFAEKWEKSGYHWLNHSLVSLYKILWDFYGEEDSDLLAWLCYDFRVNESRQLTPEWMGGLNNRSRENELIQSNRLSQILPELADLPPREISRKIFVEELSFKKGTEKILFYYSELNRSAQVFRL